MNNTKQVKSKSYLDKLKPLVFHKDTKVPKSLKDLFTMIYVSRCLTYRIDKNGKYSHVGNQFNSRSAQDVYLTARSYFEKVSYEDIKNICKTLQRKKALLGHFCHTCHRTVYCRGWITTINKEFPEHLNITL